MKPTLTVFTPAYNRAYTLGRTYESLLSQGNKDFIWLIVDDGSTDNTSELVGEWQKKDNGFEIRYIYKENGGMHTAHNTAYENIDTELNVCIDSDDIMAENGVDLILRKWESVKALGFAGIIALDADFDGNVIGYRFPEELTDTTLFGYYHRGGKGDKKLVYRTDIIKATPEYPVFGNEKYVSLGYKYLIIDQTYTLAVLNEVVCKVEYLPDGSTKNMLRQYLRNPRGFACWRRLQMTYPVGFFRMCMDCVHYVSSSVISKNKAYIKESPRKVLTVLCTPFGLILSVVIKNKGGKND